LLAVGSLANFAGLVVLVVGGPLPGDSTQGTALADFDEGHRQQVTIFGAWWEHLILAAYLCYLLAGVALCRLEGRTAPGVGAAPPPACSAAVACSGGLFCISTVVVLVYLVSVDNVWDLLQFWDELTCDFSNIVCLVHEFVGRLLLAVVTGIALLLLAAAAAAAAMAAAAQAADKK
jgi:hypothetical protein